MLALKVGDKVTRLLSGTIPMEMTVVAIDDKKVYCSAGGVGRAEGEEFDPETFSGWTFDREFGYEIDLDLGWGVDRDGNGKILTGSYLTLEKEEAWKQ